MGQRLDERLIGVLESGVFAHNRDGDLALGRVHGLGHCVPAGHVGLGRGLDAEAAALLGFEVRNRLLRAEVRAMFV